MSAALYKLDDHPRRKELSAKLQKLKDGLCAGLTADQIVQTEVAREAAIIGAAMDRIKAYTSSKSAMVEVVEGLLQEKTACAPPRR